MPVITPVEVSPCAKPIILIFLPLPARCTSSATIGFPQGASTFTTFEDARVAISYMRSEKTPLTATMPSSPSSSEFSTAASIPPDPDAESGMVTRFSVWKICRSRICVSSMHPLNHGSMCPTRGVAIARYTRGSMEDGPGVSINRTGGWSSPTCCVMTFCPSSFLRLILAFESRTARECALGDFSCYGGNLNFRAIPTPTQPTIWLGLLVCTLLSETGGFGISAATNRLIRGILGKEHDAQRSYCDVTPTNSLACSFVLARCTKHFQGTRR